jgi:hypothetical protein
MNTSTINYIGGLLFVSAILGCSPEFETILDPNQPNNHLSSNLRWSLNRISVSDDGRVASSNENEITVSSLSGGVSIKIHNSSEAQYSPLISPDGDRLASVRFSNGNPYIDLHSLTESSRKPISYRLGRELAIPIRYCSGIDLLLVEVYSSDGIGQGVIVQPGVLALSSGDITLLGDKAVVDSSGTHVLVSRGMDLYKASFSQISRMNRIAQHFDVLAISIDSNSVVAKDKSGSLQVIDLSTMVAKPLGIAGHSAFFMGAKDRIAVVTGSKNSISILDTSRRTSTQVTDWNGYNSLPVQSSNGRYLAFERFDDEFGRARTIFIYDNAIETLSIHSTREL